MKNHRYRTKTHLRKEADTATKAYYILMGDIRAAAEELHARKDEVCTGRDGLTDLSKTYAYNKALEILKAHLGILSLSKEDFDEHVKASYEV